MHSFFATVPVEGATTTIQVVYPNHQLGDQHLTAGIDEVVENYNRRLVPSRLLFVCPCPMASRVQTCFENKRAHYEKRLQSISHVTIVPFDDRGLIVSPSVVQLYPSAAEWSIGDEFLFMLARRGISVLFEGTETILHAPHGYSFRKPSGREEDIFVRAGNMLRQPSALSVFNHLLLRYLPPNCAVLYIDSFTILSFAMGLQSILASFDLPAPAIKNIHSYDITRDVWISNEKNYMVLISASTSGGLARKLVDEYQADSSRIVHLLGVGPASSPFRDSCIYFHTRETKGKATKTGGQANATIEIRTEEFLVSQGTPRPVRITKAHVHDCAADHLHKAFYQGALQFGRSGFNRSYSPFSVAPGTENAAHSPLHTWAKTRLVHELPASVRTLLHVDDGMARLIAEWLSEELGPHVSVKALARLDPDTEDASPGNTIAVIAHHDPDLEDLAGASIALRDLPDVHRHYVVCYGFPSSRVEYERQRADLRMTSNRQRYGWSEFLVMPVGAAMLHDSFAIHRGALSPDSLQGHAGALGDCLHDALRHQGESRVIDARSLFLPRTSGEPLALRPGSVFLPQGSLEVSQIAVYATVAGAVQCAREPKTVRGQETLGFDDNPFVRAVLDPSMFARYSDGILQASLLRCAQRSELDYSGSDELSLQFASICSSILLNHGNSVGEAAPEFLYALATEKVVLREADHTRIAEKIGSVPILNAVFELFRSADLSLRASGWLGSHRVRSKLTGSGPLFVSEARWSGCESATTCAQGPRTTTVHMGRPIADQPWGTAKPVPGQFSRSPSRTVGYSIPNCSR